MSEQFKEQRELENEAQNVQGTQTVENSDPVVDTPEMASGPEVPPTKKVKLSKEMLAIIGAAAIAVILLVVLISRPSKFEKVKSECMHITGSLPGSTKGIVTGSDDYFMVDTYPDQYENFDAEVVAMLAPSAQEKALEAIKYANEELGFNGSVYSQMMHTTALMGRQSEGNSKYKVSWTYHPDDGLEVTYEKK